MASVEMGESVQPMAKRPRCGRVALDVGGVKFVTSASTLTSNSHYFAALLSGDWAESGDEELYIDQDPAAFKVLLDYMRSGMIKVAKVDENVLLLAEFLGMETLMSATKIRWLVNLGRGPSLSDDSSDEEIVAAFDEEYGGINKAIGAGLFPSFLAMDLESKCQYEVAEVAMVQGNALVAREFVGREGPIETQCGPLGAINGLCSKGYVRTGKDEIIDDFDRGDRFPGVQLQYLRRRKYIQLLPRTEHVFAPSDEDRQVKSTLTRFQYAHFIENNGGEVDAILAPPEFSSDEVVRSDPFGVAVIQPVPPCWAESNGFVKPKLYHEVHSISDAVIEREECPVLKEIVEKVESYNILDSVYGYIILEREI